jgi:hypothetical protein
MAARLHIGKAADIVNDAHLLDRYVVPFDDPGRAAEYLAALPRLIERTHSQDARCAQLWESRLDPGVLEAYVHARARLRRLLLRFRFPLRSYERLVRQPHKPILDRAKDLLAQDAGRPAELQQLESLVRMSLREFVDAEEAIAGELRMLDGVRTAIVAAYRGYAQEKAEALAGPDPEAVRYALAGLRKAAENYNHRRGYPFRTYARHWIETAVRDRRTWGA